MNKNWSLSVVYMKQKQEAVNKILNQVLKLYEPIRIEKEEL